MGTVYRPPFTVLASGRAVCHREPHNGEHGLEGYNEGESYRFQRVQNRTGTHVRVYPEDEDGACPEYFECCGAGIFERYFRVQMATSLSGESR